MERRANTLKREMKNLYPLVAFTKAQVQLAYGEAKLALEQFTGRSHGFRHEDAPDGFGERRTAANVLAQMGRTEEADVKRTEARAVIEQIAGMFIDKEMRGRLSEARFKGLESLRGEIEMW